MARLFVFDCTCGNFKKVKRVEYTPPSNSKHISGSRYIIDLKSEADHNGYPPEVITCTCGLEITSQEFEIGKVPPVYFNYMGDDD